jgi:hypothetical protein
MSLRRFIPIAGGGPLLDKIQALLFIVLDQLQGDRVANDHLVSVTLASGADTPVYHGLEGPIRTWDIVRQDADARIWEGGASTAPSKFFNLTASGAVRVTVRCC